MSTCKLDTHAEYDLNMVQFDRATKSVAVKISNPPASCPEGFFTHDKATIMVDPNISISKLTYTDHPVILVHDKAMVQVVNKPVPAPVSHDTSSSFPFGTIIILALILAAIWYAWKRNFFKSANPVPSENNISQSFEMPSTFKDSSATHSTTSAKISSGGTDSTPPYRRGGSNTRNNARNTAAEAGTNDTVIHTITQPAVIPAPIVVANNGPGFFTGMVMGEMMSGGLSGHNSTTIIHDHDVVHDHDYSRDDSNDSNHHNDASNTPSTYESDSDKSPPASYESSSDDSYTSSNDTSSYTSSSDSSYSSSDSSYSSSDSGSYDSGGSSDSGSF